MKRFLVLLLKLPSLFAIALVRIYQWTIRPILGPRCRYLPHCSDYAIEALQHRGLFSGGWLTAKRLGRCHPWCVGGLDPVPQTSKNQPFSSQTSLSD
jgi:uncharacterized protein